MTDRWKYVVLMDGSMLIGDPALTHAEIAAGKAVLSAGFLSLGQSADGKRVRFVCYGESVSLKSYSDPGRDALRANRLLGGVEGYELD